jgi:Arc/MetJ-type ribon-helix-helix transcriptional regulator
MVTCVMEKTTVYLNTSLQHNLAQTARQLGKSQAELIRQAVTEYLERHAPKREFASLGAGEDTELSARDADEFLRAAWDKR